MQFDRTAREYITRDLQDVPAGGTLEVSIDDKATWHPLTVIDDTGRFLAAGPDAPGTNPPEALVLTLNRNLVWFRATADPQSIPRFAGPIDVT